jgi:hypothetical protein
MSDERTNVTSQSLNLRTEERLKRGQPVTDMNKNVLPPDLQESSYWNAIKFTALPHSLKRVLILFHHLHNSCQLPRLTVELCMHRTCSIHLTLVCGLLCYWAILSVSGTYRLDARWMHINRENWSNDNEKRKRKSSQEHLSQCYTITTHTAWTDMESNTHYSLQWC